MDERASAGMKAQLREAGLGRLLYQIWYRPVGRLRQMMRAGGPLEERRTENGRREMEEAARSLMPPPRGSGSPLELHLLTGALFWYQTAFCLWTFARESGRPLRPHLYDDGSLLDSHRESLRHLFPEACFIGTAQVQARLDTDLPAGRFPVLRERQRNYPNIRKLLDVHVGTTGWKLVLDSDLLFFRRPDLLVEWMDRPERPLHAVDCETSYGYSRMLLEELAGRPLAERVNVGLTGLNSSELDWDRIESWCQRLIDREQTSYYLEQALIALLLAGRPCTVAPAEDYVTLPQLPEATACRAVMHHYVADSKRWYFQQNWRRVLDEGATTHK